MNPKVHTFGSTREAYDASQTDDRIRDGDVLLVESESVGGVLIAAWPVAFTPERGCFHTLSEGVEWSNVEGVDYTPSIRAAGDWLRARVHERMGDAAEVIAMQRGGGQG